MFELGKQLFRACAYRLYRSTGRTKRKPAPFTARFRFRVGVVSAHQDGNETKRKEFFDLQENERALPIAATAPKMREIAKALERMIAR